MPHELIGDRFLPDGSGRGIDLVTGETIDVLVRSLETEWRAIEEQLREEFHSSRARRLIDYGLVNANRWFEARTLARAAPSVRRRARNSSAVDEVVSVAEAPGPGIRHVPIAWEESERTGVLEEMARRLRPAGFVTIDASLEIPGPLRAELTHRHLAVHFRSEADRAPVVRWIRHLADVSPRAHVIVELTRGAAASRSPGLRTRAPRFTRGAFGGHVMSPTSWNRRVSTAARQAHAYIARSRPDLAESLLASVSVEATVRGECLPGAIETTWARLRTLQGRDEGAQRFAGFANSHLEELTDASCSSHSRVAAAGARR